MTGPPVYIPELLRRLGDKSRQLPALLGSVTPVQVIGEFSSGLSNDPLEARGFAGGVSANNTLEIQANAAGGIVIEAFSITAGNPINMEIFQAPFIAAAPVVRNVLQCGGATARSVVRTGVGGASVAPVEWGLGVTIPLRLFVPPGSFWTLKGPGAIAFSVLWRELAAGGPT